MTPVALERLTDWFLPGEPASAFFRRMCDGGDTTFRGLRVTLEYTIEVRGFLMICILLGPMLGLDHSIAAMLGITESLLETAILTTLSQKYLH